MSTTLLPPTHSSARLAPYAGPEAQKLARLGQDRHWDFGVLGRAPLPAEPVRIRDWMIVPIEHDSSRIPARTLERVQAIFAAGLRPKGFVVVHEAPAQLAAPKPALAPGAAFSSSLGSAVKAMEPALGGVVLALAQMLGMAAAGLPLMLLFGLMALDPILVAVTEEGDWVEIDRWWN